LKSDGRERYP